MIGCWLFNLSLPQNGSDAFLCLSPIGSLCLCPTLRNCQYKIQNLCLKQKHVCYSYNYSYLDNYLPLTNGDLLTRAFNTLCCVWIWGELDISMLMANKTLTNTTQITITRYNILWFLFFHLITSAFVFLNNFELACVVDYKERKVTIDSKILVHPWADANLFTFLERYQLLKSKYNPPLKHLLYLADRRLISDNRKLQWISAVGVAESLELGGNYRKI